MNTGTSELGQRVSWWTDRRRAIITDPRSTASTPSLICYRRLRDESGVLHTSPPLGTLSLKLVYYHVADLCGRAAPRFFGSWRLVVFLLTRLNSFLSFFGAGLLTSLQD